MSPRDPAGPPGGAKRFKPLDELLATDDKQHEDVWVAEWHSYVRLRVMTGNERDEWEQQIVTQREAKDYRNIRGSMVALTMVDEQGQRMVTTPEQQKALGEKSAAALETLFVVARRLNRLDDKDIKELEGNSVAGPSGLPGTSSR